MWKNKYKCVVAVLLLILASAVAVPTAAGAAIQNVTVSSAPQFTISLYEDWNLVSTPLEPHDTYPVSFFSPIAENCSIVWAYNASESKPWDKWKKYIPDAPPFASTLEKVDHKIGFWVKMEEDDNLTVTGSAPVTTSIDLKTGWNMIGYPSTTTKPVGEALSSINGNYDTVYAYNATDTENHWKIYNPLLPSWVEQELEDMVPGSGYWINMTSECTLEI